MAKKKAVGKFFGTMGIIGAGTLVVLAILFIFVRFSGFSMSALGGTNVNVGTTGIKGYATEDVTLLTSDALDKVTATKYFNASITPVVDGVALASVSAVGSAGGKMTVAVGKAFSYIDVPTGAYTVCGDAVADFTKSLQIESYAYAVPELDVKLVSTGAFNGGYNSTDSNIDLTSLGLVAGAGSKTYELYAQIPTAYKQFSMSKPILGCTELSSTKYTVGSDMTEIPMASFPAKLIDASVKKAWYVNPSSISATMGQVKIGTLTVALNGGQTGATFVCTLYDVANAKSIDGKTCLKNVISDDSSAMTDVGATNPTYTFTV